MGQVQSLQEGGWARETSRPHCGQIIPTREKYYYNSSIIPSDILVIDMGPNCLNECTFMLNMRLGVGQKYPLKKSEGFPEWINPFLFTDPLP